MLGQMELELDGAATPKPAGPARASRRASVLLQPSRGVSLRVRSRRAPADRDGAADPGDPETADDPLSGPDDPCFDAWKHAIYEAGADGADGVHDDDAHTGAARARRARRAGRM